MASPKNGPAVKAGLRRDVEMMGADPAVARRGTAPGEDRNTVSAVVSEMVGAVGNCHIVVDTLLQTISPTPMLEGACGKAASMGLLEHAEGGAASAVDLHDKLVRLATLIGERN